MQNKNAVMRRCAVVALLGLGALAATGVAVAQDSDLQPLLDRIDRLERDVNMLQRQVYRGTSPSGTPMAVTPPDGSSALSEDVRIDQIESEMRALTGQIEQANYAINQLKQRLDALSNDVDERFQMLGQGKSSSNAGTAAAGATAMAGGGGAVAQGQGGTAVKPAQPGILGTLREPADNASASAAPPADSSPQAQYNAAFGLLRRADYPDAEQALKTFIKRYPNDALAGNAQYWLGETYYVRQDYADAATAFAIGYQKYPHSGKSVDNLLKLGMSLGNLGKKSEACSAFAHLDHEFPTAPPNVKERVASEQRQMGC